MQNSIFGGEEGTCPQIVKACSAADPTGQDLDDDRSQ